MTEIDKWFIDNGWKIKTHIDDKIEYKETNTISNEIFAYERYLYDLTPTSIEFFDNGEIMFVGFYDKGFTIVQCDSPLLEKVTEKAKELKKNRSEE